MEIKSKLLELIERSDRAEQALFERLSEEERSVVGKADCWSPKDVLVHVAGWKARLAENLAAAARGETPVRHEDYEAVNAREFEENRDLPWPEVLEKVAEASRLLVEQVEARSEDELRGTETLPWQEDRPLWRLIAGNGVIHPLAMHLGPIYVERGDVTFATGLQEEVAALLRELDDGESWQGLVRYNLACHHALVGDTACALGELKEALKKSTELVEWSKEDTDLA